eukprot:364914-Chlamydomonas_euryale.AAC.11
MALLLMGGPLKVTVAKRGPNRGGLLLMGWPLKVAVAKRGPNCGGGTAAHGVAAQGGSSKTWP